MIVIGGATQAALRLAKPGVTREEILGSLSEDPNGVNEPRNVSEEGQGDIEPEMQGEPDPEKHSEWRQQNRAEDAHDLAARRIIWGSVVKDHRRGHAFASSMHRAIL